MVSVHLRLGGRSAPAGRGAAERLVAALEVVLDWLVVVEWSVACRSLCHRPHEVERPAVSGLVVHGHQGFVLRLLLSLRPQSP